MSLVLDAGALPALPGDQVLTVDPGDLLRLVRAREVDARVVRI